jgi:hypothetical protein
MNTRVASSSEKVLVEEQRQNGRGVWPKTTPQVLFISAANNNFFAANRSSEHL